MALVETHLTDSGLEVDGNPEAALDQFMKAWDAQRLTVLGV